MANSSASNANSSASNANSSASNANSSASNANSSASNANSSASNANSIIHEDVLVYNRFEVLRRPMPAAAGRTPPGREVPAADSERISPRRMGSEVPAAAASGRISPRRMGSEVPADAASGRISPRRIGREVPTGVLPKKARLGVLGTTPEEASKFSAARLRPDFEERVDVIKSYGRKIEEHKAAIAVHEREIFLYDRLLRRMSGVCVVYGLPLNPKYVTCSMEYCYCEDHHDDDDGSEPYDASKVRTSNFKYMEPHESESDSE